MPVSPARRIAYDVLRQVESEGAHAADALHAELSSKIKSEDAALATEITLGVLRWQRLLDHLLGQHVSRPFTELDRPVRLALRIGLYQLRYLDRIPARAAVSESVELAKRAKKHSAAGLVNAVLRKVADTAREPAEKFIPADLDPADRVALLHSHPTWLVKRWLGRWGDEATRALLAAHNQPPGLALAVHDETHLADVRQELEAAGLKTEPGRWLRSALNVSGGAAAVVVAQSAAWRQGWVSMQDEASQTVPLLLGVSAGQRVLDVCAAPGGKTVPLARAAGDGAVIAADNDARRLAAVGAHLQRTGVTNVQLAAFDAAAGIGVAGAFDRILCDVPCSGTGTLRRNPEIRWRLRAEDLTSFHAKQARILRNAVAALAPGGRLVYATCSLEPEENELVVREVMASNAELKLLPAAEALAPHLLNPKQSGDLTDAQGFFRTLPHQHGTDGFFAAVLER